jgi:DNA-binding SARP family transcriptional activator
VVSGGTHAVESRGGVEFRILGPLEVASPDGIVEVGGAKRRALLALLLVHANQVVARDRLIDDLWEGSSRESAIGTLQTYVSQLRKALQLESLSTRPGGYLLEVGPGELDALRFELAIGEVSGAEDAAPSWVASRLGEALAWWRGPALADFEGEFWAQPEATRLEELRFAAVERLMDARLALGEHVALVPELEVLVAKHPFREGLWAQLMLAMYRSDRQADALRTYGRLRRHLGEELGIEPSKELVALEEAIVLQKPELDWERPERVASSAAHDLPTGTVTFLLTDIESSTRLWDEHPEAMQDALVRHDAILRDAIEANRGHVVKSMGDGMVAVFGDAGDAVGATVAAQCALSVEPWVVTGPLRVRMGLHSGEAQHRGGDYFGAALNRAARIMSAGHGGQVLCSAATGALARDTLPPGVELVDLGGASPARPESSRDDFSGEPRRSGGRVPAVEVAGRVGGELAVAGELVYRPAE